MDRQFAVHRPLIDIKYEISQVVALEQTVQTLLSLSGYQMIDTPLIEPIDLFLTKAGSQFIDKLFVIDQQNLQLALRPEFTASALLRYITQEQTRQRSVRWQFRGPVFQLESASQSKNYIQRYSLGAELIGIADVSADAEIISLATQVITSLKIEDWILTIGDLSVLRSVINQFDLDNRTQRFLLNQRFNFQDSDIGKEKVLHNLQKLLGDELDYPPDNNTLETAQTQHTQQMLDILLDTTQRGQTMGGRTRHDIAQRLLNKQQRLSERERITAALDFLHQWAQIEGTISDVMTQVRDLTPNVSHVLDNWMRLFGLIEVYGIDLDRVRIKPDLVRNWDYYTGAVFEIRTQDGLLLAGGGRYDELARLVGSEIDVPAVGFAVYMDNVLGLSPTQQPKQKWSMQYTPTNVVSAIRWAAALRQRQIPIELIMAGNDAPNTLHVVDDTLQIETVRYHIDEIDIVVEKLTHTHE